MRAGLVGAVMVACVQPALDSPEPDSPAPDAPVPAPTLTARPDRGVSPREPLGGNLLLVVVDDWGVDKFSRFDAHPNPPHTPRLDAMADDGVLFERAYAYPTCSPSRAALMTGRHARRTGIGRPISSGADPSDPLSLDEVALPEMLHHSPLAYTSHLVGKWHLSIAADEGGATHPLEMGFDHHVGLLGNPGGALADGSERRAWYRWEEHRDGEMSVVDGYLTTSEVDHALEIMASAPEPWFLMLSFHAPHSPAHVPPPELLSEPVTEADHDVRLYAAAMEALDTELGRLLDEAPPDVLARTTTVVMGDNGTPPYVTTLPFDFERAKGTVWEGGVHVPLLVTGPHVGAPGRTSDALIHIVDVPVTLAAIAGVPVESLFGSAEAPGLLAPWPVDGVSFVPAIVTPDPVPGRELIYTERFAPNHALPRPLVARSVRDRTWRLRVKGDHREELYFLGDGWFDGDDLLQAPLDATAEDARARLRAALDAVTASLTPPP